MSPKLNASNASPAVGGTAGSDTPTRTGSISQKDPAARRKQASQDWNDFQDILQRVSKHAREYSDMDQTIKENSALQSALAEKTAELSEKDKRISFIEAQMLNTFEARYKKWDKETADLKRQLEREKNQAETTHKRKVQSMEAELGSLQENVYSLDSRLAQATEEADFARKECDINKHRLQEWDNYLSQLKDMNLNDL
jgi:chromosome segregation ATPase